MHEQLTQWWESISLRSKITGVTVFVVTVGLLVVGVGTLTVLQRTLVDEVDRQLRQAADELPGSFAVDEFDSFDDLTPSIFSNPFYFGAVDADGVLIDDNITMANRAQARAAAAAAPAPASAPSGAEFSLGAPAPAPTSGTTGGGGTSPGSSSSASAGAEFGP